jgi:4-aminobutyrate aminotransferase-like enzyme
MELIQGEGGFRTAPKEFFLPLLKLLKEHGVSVWVDEVQTLGRTEEIFVYQSLGLDEWVDIVTLGKMAQVCATLYRESYRPKPGLISQTFTSSASAIMAGITIFEKLLDRPWASQKLKGVRAEFEEVMVRLQSKHSLVGDLRGRGGMMAFVLGAGVMDETKAFLNLLFERGVIGFLAGANPVCVRFLPPWMIIESAHIKEFEDIMDATLTDFVNDRMEVSDVDDSTFR